jgi:antitoxin VapB
MHEENSGADRKTGRTTSKNRSKDTGRKSAAIFMNNRNQAVRLPKGFEFAERKVWIRREGDEVILSPCPMDWSEFMDSDLVASSGFMRWVEDLPLDDSY